MRIEYFQLIDHIVDLDLDARTIRVDAQVPQESTIFEGHFPGHPLMPGVLLIEAMAQTSGWLLIAHTKFTRMPFFAAVKEAKLRSFVTPGQVLSVSAKLATVMAGEPHVAVAAPHVVGVPRDPHVGAAEGRGQVHHLRVQHGLGVLVHGGRAGGEEDGDGLRQDRLRRGTRRGLELELGPHGVFV